MTTRRRRAVWLMLLVLVPVGLATVVGLIALWPGDGPSRAEQAAASYVPPGTTFPQARIAKVTPKDCTVDPSAPLTCADVVVVVDATDARTGSSGTLISATPPIASRPRVATPAARTRRLSAGERFAAEGFSR